MKKKHEKKSMKVESHGLEYVQMTYIFVRLQKKNEIRQNYKK